MSISDDVASAVPDPRTLARTYLSPTHEDPWDAVREYQAVTAYAAEHPEKGSAAIASEFEVPRGRIRPWLNNGSMPDPARAVQIADTQGWLVRDTKTPEARALAGLVAWVLSGGAITARHYTPYFCINERAADASKTDLETLADELDLSLRTNDRDEGRVTEVTLPEHSSTFGRCLAAAGAPVGEKTTDQLTVPKWIREGPPAVRKAFVSVYLGNRAVRTGHSDVLQIHEEQRPAEYYAQLATTVESVADQGTVTASAQHVRADTDATAQLLALGRSPLGAVLHK